MLALGGRGEERATFGALDATRFRGTGRFNDTIVTRGVLIPPSYPARSSSPIERYKILRLHIAATH